MEWEAFARELWPGVATDPFTLRDHAEGILREAAQDMQSEESAASRLAKSRGSHDANSGLGGFSFNATANPAARTQNDGELLVKPASELHAFARVRSGFDLQAVVAEYRALRAAVIRLWRESLPRPDTNDLDDLTRFNEAIDQSLAEASGLYVKIVDRARQLYLAILGHDLRNPLTSVMMSAQILPRIGSLDEQSSKVVAQISSSAIAMRRMISDLLDFTGAGLGAAMPLTPTQTDFGQVCRDVVDELRAANPTRRLNLALEGDLVGHWDGARLRQVVSNLAGNAIQHGAESGPVDVTARRVDETVELIVHNGGPAIDPRTLISIFEPLITGAAPELQKHRRPGSIGLGLYIARQIVLAHGGTIDVTSTTEAGTHFRVALPIHPRTLPAEGAGRVAS